MRKFLMMFLALISLAQLHSEDITWSSPPVTLSSMMTDSSNPEVGIDSSGNAVAIWVEGGFIKSSSILFGGSWDAAVTISNTNTSSPSLVVDSSGNATAVWLEGTALKTAAKPFGGSWGSGATLSNSGAASPQLAIDNSGNVVLVWANSGLIQTKTKLFGGSWSSTTTLSAAGADSPQVSIGSNGQVVAVWHGLLSLVDTIFSANKTISLGTWSAASAISNPANSSINPQIAVDSNGNALAVWYIFDQSGSIFSNVYLQSAYKPSGLTWNLPILVSTTTQGFYDPSKLTALVKFDSAGTAIAVWMTSSDGSSFTVSSTILPTGGNGSWVTPQIDLIVDNNFALSFDLSVPASRDAFLDLMFSDGVNIVIDSVVSNIDAFVQNFWAFAGSLSQGNNNGFPKIAAAISGSNIYAVSLWVQNGTNNVIQAVTASGTILQPPTNLTVMQSFTNFGIFTEYFNTLSWTASSSPNVAGYIIFRDDVFLGQVDAFTTQFVDGNRTQNVSNTYGVATIDNAGTQSSIATITFP